jgi:preprotein translocase subunit SecG
MDPISIILLVLLVISALLLIGVVLLQDEQGEGIGGIFGGGSNTAFGSRMGNVLTRFTTVLAAVFLFCCLGFAYNQSRMGGAGNVVGKAREQALSGETTQWWVESSATPASAAATEAGVGGAGTAADAATTTPAGGGK